MERRGRKPKIPGESPAYRNITVDADMLELIHDAQAKLSEELGFDVTISQTLKHLLKKAIK